MKDINVEKLYECYVLSDYTGYEEYEKYQYYFDKFDSNFIVQKDKMGVLVKILDKYYDKMQNLNIEFINELQRVDRMQLVGISTGNPIYALGILFNRQEYPFNYNYYKYFKILFEAAKIFNFKELNEVNKYQDKYEEAKGLIFTKYKDLVNQEKYINFQYNYHMLVTFATAYAYYMNYEPSKITTILDFFIRNYDQIVNTFDVNGFTREDLSFNMDGFSYLMEYCDKNTDKEELKRIL